MYTVSEDKYVTYYYNATDETINQVSKETNRVLGSTTFATLGRPEYHYAIGNTMVRMSWGNIGALSKNTGGSSRMIVSNVEVNELDYNLFTEGA